LDRIETTWLVGDAGCTNQAKKYRRQEVQWMKLDEHAMRLIAIGASVAANCQVCLDTNLARAKECGADTDEITQAIWVGRMVRKSAASKMDEPLP
jgi:AhpD family alkylhydroperoxidase